MVRGSIVVLCALVATVSACGSTAPSSQRLRVVASFYPLAEVAQRVGGSRVAVENLTTTGAEPHDLELLPSQVAAIDDAAAVIDMGRGFQPAVERVASRNKHQLAVLDSVPPAVHPGDPHIWLDPSQMALIADRVERLLAGRDVAHAATYAANAARYKAALTALDDRFRTGLADCTRREVVTSHQAFGWLAARFGLTQIAITGLNPEVEASPQRMSELTDLVRQHHVTTIFTETLLSPRAASALAREASVRTDVLDPIEGLTRAEQAAHADYISLMDINLSKLRSALACR